MTVSPASVRIFTTRVVLSIEITVPVMVWRLVASTRGLSPGVPAVFWSAAATGSANSRSDKANQTDLLMGVSKSEGGHAARDRIGRTISPEGERSSVTNSH